MKALELQFDSRGFTHRQIVRRGNLAIYERARVGSKQPPHYELVRIKSHNGFKIPGTEKITPPAEIYPSAEQWGTNGFTFNDEDKARERMTEMEAA